MKKILLFVFSFSLMITGCKLKSKDVIEYKIDDLPYLIEAAYEEVYGLNVKVENIIGVDSIIDNNESKGNNLYEISIDDSFYHFYSTYRLSLERYIIQNLEVLYPFKIT